MESLTLWKITGHVNRSSGVGEESYYVLLPNDVLLPDVEAILPGAAEVYGDRTTRMWSWIERIERLGQVPTVVEECSVAATYLLKLTRGAHWERDAIRAIG